MKQLATYDKGAKPPSSWKRIEIRLVKKAKAEKAKAERK